MFARFHSLRHTFTRPWLGRSLAVALAASLVVAGGSAAGASQARSISSHSSTVKPDFAYFAGKTITIIDSQAPGGSYSPALLIMQPLLAAYLHATINISYVPAGNTITGQNDAAASTPNGLTIGIGSMGTDIGFFQTHTAGLAFSLQKLEFLTGFHISPVMVGTCPGSPFTSLAQVMASKTPVTLLTTPGAITQHMQAFFGTYGVPLKILSGYSSTASEVAGCLRGDGQLIDTAVSAVTPSSFSSAGGPIRMLFVSPPVLKQSVYYPASQSAVTLNQYVAKNPPKDKVGKAAMKILLDLIGPSSPATTYFVAPGTPQKYVLALSAAFKAIRERASTINAMNAAGAIPQYVSGAAQYAATKQLIKVATSSAYERWFSYGM